MARPIAGHLYGLIHSRAELLAKSTIRLDHRKIVGDDADAVGHGIDQTLQERLALADGTKAVLQGRCHLVEPVTEHGQLVLPRHGNP